MAFFVGAGTIAEEVVRKETRNGVLAVFRLETGAPNDRRLWIDVEAWGQLAGTVSHHGSAGRSVLVSGRLTYKSWRDQNSGEARNRLVVTAFDVDLLAADIGQVLLPTSVVATGTIETVYPDRPTKAGTVYSFRIASGRAGSKTGRLWLDIEHWAAAKRPASDFVLRLKEPVSVVGAIDYRRIASDGAPTSATSGLFLRCRQLYSCPRLRSAT